MNSHTASPSAVFRNSFAFSASLMLLCIVLALLSGCAASKSGSVTDAGDPAQQNQLPDALDRSTPDAATETAIQKAQDEKARLSAAQQVVATAKSQIGVPYRYGGTSPSSGFDCSGFVKWSFAQHGVTLPRTSREQLHAGIPVDQSELKAGDLIIFTRRIGSRASTHAGLYIGDGKFIHSPSAGRTVCIESLHDEHYQKRYIGARRVILDADEVKIFAAQQKKRQEFRESGAIHTVKRGQTLSGIARKYGVTVRSILRENKLTRSNILQIGQKLRIPGATSVAAKEDKPTPKVIDATPAATSANHTVASGDSVWSIARRYGVSQQSILQANNLPRRHTLQIGQNLVIPGKQTAAAESTHSQEPELPATAETSPEIKAGASCAIYIVQAGDTAWSVAKRHSVSPDTLLQANGLAKNHVLQIGQQLRVPGTVTASDLAESRDSRESQKPRESREPRKMQIYSVKRGDTIWSLARKHGVSASTLLEANGLHKNSVLSLGQKLRIPVAAVR